MSICMKYSCIITLKPLYALLVMDMKHTLHSHINMLFISFPRLKYSDKNFVKKNLF